MTEAGRGFPMKDMQPEKLPTTELVKAFANKNRVSVNNTEVACGDDRYTSLQSNGAIRLFGADLGVLMAVRSVINKKQLVMPVKELYGKYKTAVKAARGKEAKVDYHSDEKHEDTEDPGCGHAGLSSNIENAGFYENLSPQDVQEIYGEVRGDAEANCVMLAGSHGAKAVIVVDSPTDVEAEFSVHSQDSETGEMYYVVDQARANKYIGNIVGALGIEGVEAEEVMDAANSFTGTTAGFLAKDFQQFQVIYDKDGNPEVSVLGEVPAPVKKFS